MQSDEEIKENEIIRLAFKNLARDITRLLTFSEVIKILTLNLEIIL